MVRAEHRLPGVPFQQEGDREAEPNGQRHQQPREGMREHLRHAGRVRWSSAGEGAMLGGIGEMTPRRGSGDGVRTYERVGRECGRIGDALPIEPPGARRHG